MKRLIVSTALIFCFCFLFAQKSDEKILLGLFTAHIENFEYVSGKIKEIHYQSYSIIDQNGTIITGEPLTYSQSDYVMARQPHSLSFNKMGQLIKISIKLDNGNTLTGVVHYDNNKITRIYWLNQGNPEFLQDYNYLPNGNIERVWKSVETNDIVFKDIYELDKDGNLLKSTAQKPNGEVQFISVFTRNENGRIATYKGIDSDENEKHYYNNYIYNDKGLLKSLHLVKLNGENITVPDSEINYEYDEHGNWTKAIYRPSFMTERRFVYFN